MTSHSQPSAGTTILIWALLMILATLSLVVAHFDSGALGVTVALGIAAIKAVLVAMVFMHLWHGLPLLRAVILIGVAFVLLLLGGVLADVGTRDTAGPYLNHTSISRGEKPSW
jgi:cytochrome c oxidase subunit 4